MENSMNRICQVDVVKQNFKFFMIFQLLSHVAASILIFWIIESSIEKNISGMHVDYKYT